MVQYFLSKILDGLRFEHDFVKTWLPLLQDTKDAKSEHYAVISKLGAVSLATVGLAAVEQYAKEKKLKNGTVQDLRFQAFSIYQQALTRTIYENAQIRILELLGSQRPELADWVRNATEEIRIAREEIWQRVVAETAQILRDIQGQQYRKGHKGRLEVFGGKGIKPAHRLRDLVDAELLKNAVNALPISQQNEISAIRKNTRTLVIDYVIRGLLQTGAQSQADAVDKHAKRLFRKLAIVTKTGNKAKSRA